MFSIIMPCESERIPLLLETLASYKCFTPHKFFVELIIPTRSMNEYDKKLVAENNPFDSIIFVDYEHTGDYFNPSRALNFGVKHSSFKNLIITCPEVKPETNVLCQLLENDDQNVICQVWDLNPDGSKNWSLVNSQFRSDNPSMYFLAKFNIKDIQTINGWDEEFMKGYAWEDDDFGRRFKRAGIPFIVRDDIVGAHQYHQRLPMNEGWSINKRQLDYNDDHNIIRPKNGLIKE